MSEKVKEPNLVTFEFGGVLGKKFGKEHRVKCITVRQGISIINCNRQGVLAWMKQNATKYQKYHIRVTRANGTIRDMSETEYQMENHGDMVHVCVTPIYRGAGAKVMGAIQAVIGAVLIVVGLYTQNYALALAGASMLIGGVMGLLTKTPNPYTGGADNRKNSTYFDGPQNTVEQGAPVPIIYGEEILVGSQLISLKLSVEQLIN
ncbi:tail assembly protein [Xenorhabdus szentirmaii]|uniref:Phage tail assembly protein n=1 Tax=Xenorhabdus szentirmaii DSM 16338 TaxID=1427518 RepID=W1IT31_9GAMM|nr:tail assembly protein [Xenorhabdus szentirmaii]PHM30512.1 putative tail component of prophage [Xenorhabdus szentirmaii DSM 16338]CDL80968.1 putative phage tail assembly protein [Xenorhabdus szentirmaii DSM 16338]